MCFHFVVGRREDIVQPTKKNVFTYTILLSRYINLLVSVYGLTSVGIGVHFGTPRFSLTSMGREFDWFRFFSTSG